MPNPLYLIPRYLKATGDNCEKLYKIMDDHKAILTVASMPDHHSWPGGYLQHVADTMTITRRILNGSRRGFPVPFEWSSVVLVLFLHDIDKPFMLNRMAKDPNMQIWNRTQRTLFKGEVVATYDLKLSAEELLALNFTESDGRMNELGALCHAADILSAGLWHDHGKPEKR